MAEYDPQRSRPRRRASDDAGPAPIDEMLDANPEASAPLSAASPPASSSNGGTRHAPVAEVVDLAPQPGALRPDPPRRARLLFVLIVVGLALAGFVLRRIGASRRARRD